MLYSRSTRRNEGFFGSGNFAALLIAIGLATLLRSSFENRHDLQVLKTEYPSISFRRSLARILAAPCDGAGEVEVRAPAAGLLLIRARDRLARPGETIATLITDRPAKGAAIGRTLSNR